MIAETFLTAWRRLDDVPEAAVPWLLGVARNHIANGRRAARRRDAVVAKLATSTRREAQVLPRDDVDEGLTKAIWRLPKPEREAFMLVAWDGLRPAEAAIVAGCSRPTFRVRLHRAKKRLKGDLTKARRESGAAYITTRHAEEAR